MTSQKDQIQALISDIDGVLQKTTPRLPWVMSGEVTQQRQTLERVRNYLVSLQRRMAVQDGYQQVGNRPDLLAHDIYYQQPNHAAAIDVPHGAEPDEVTAQQMLQTVIQEMGHLRANLMQPLQSDLEAMRQQRESLLEEIRQLEAQRGALSPQGNQQQAVNEFLQALMGRLQETLPQQVAQALQSSGQLSLPSGDRPALTESTSVPAIYAAGGGITPSNTDQLIIKLDSTLKVIFESLERSVQAYQESLSQGLDRMHGLGQQGEMMFTALVNHLAQQLGREASSYLQSSGQFVQVGGTDSPATTPSGEPSGKSVADSAAQPPATQATTQAVTGTAPTSESSGDSNSGLKLPYPGAELPPPAVGSEVASVEVSKDEPASSASMDAAIDAWLKSASAATGITVEDQDLENLDLPGLSLGELDLNQIDAADLDSILETESGIDTDYLADDTSIANLPYPDLATGVEEDTEDIDAYLKRLEEQLGSEFQDELSVTSLEEAEAEIDRILSGAELTDAGSLGNPTEAAGVTVEDERDEFYESLFGAEAEVFPEEEALVDEPPATTGANPDTIAEPAQAQSEEVADDPILGWDLSHSGASPFAEAANVLEADNFAIDSNLTLEAATLDDLAATEAQSVPTMSDLLLESSNIAQPEFAPEPEDAIAPPEPVIEDEISSLTDLFEGVELPAANPAPESTLLADLTAPTVAAQPPATSLPVTPAGSLGNAEEQYTIASPEESLLPAEDQFASLDTGLLIDETTLNSLSEDLFSLEGLAGQPTQPNITQPAISDSDLTLGDWGDELGQPSEPGASSLPDLADTPPPPPPVVDRFPAPPEPTTDVFTIEGMDDLFGDLPPTPSVTPVPPPGIGTGSESPFTLEAMGELFADMSPAPSVQPVTPPGSPTSSSQAARTQPETALTAETPLFSTDAASQAIPFTLEGMDDLFADIPSQVTPSPAIAPPGEAANPVPFTLEGMDDLFDDVPPVEATAPIAASETSPQADALTFAEMEDLFADVPSVESTPAVGGESPTVAADQRSSFTLERLGDVFTEVPSTALVEPSPTQPISPSTEPFTLEQMGDVLVEVPAGSASSPVIEDHAAGFTLDRVGDLFIETPASEASQSGGAIAADPASPFTLEQVGDLFMEVPAAEGAAPESPQSSQEQDAAFTLEQVGDLFMEVPAATSPAASLDFQTLDQAFESLLGHPEPSTPAAEPLETPPQAPEKKKKAN